MADQLMADGYNGVVKFHWEKTSNVANPALILAAGRRMANAVIAKAKSLNLGKNDVVDVHFIGHSRGSVVISQALINIQNTPNLFAPLKAGYMIMTMLDPHPANNQKVNGAQIGDYDYAISATGLAGSVGVTDFQADAHDPNVLVPFIVQQADDYWQHSPVGSPFPAGTDEPDINLWGEAPAQIYVRPTLPIKSIDLTYDPTSATPKTFKGKAIGHSEVVDYYLALISRKNPDGTFKLPPEITPFK
jgi:hypothetical protein